MRRYFGSPMIQALILILSTWTTTPAWALAPPRPVSPVPVRSYFEGVNSGVAASDISAFNAEIIQQRWKEAQNTPRTQCKSKYEDDCEGPLDRGAIFALNMKALDVWNAMVSCQGDQAMAAENARKAYFEGKRLCPEKSENEKVRGELRALSFQLDDFFMTSSFDRQTAGFRIRNFRVPVLHPLLAQLVIENIASVRYIQQRKYYSPMGIGYYYRSSSVDLHNDLHSCLRLSEPDYASLDEKSREMYRKMCKGDGERNLATWGQIYFNARRLLAVDADSLESKGCSRFGLFPNASLVASTDLGLMNGQSHISEDWGASYTSWQTRPDPAMPSCWSNSQPLVAKLTSVWWSSSSDGSFTLYDIERKHQADEAHMAMTVEALEQMYRLHQTWRK